MADVDFASETYTGNETPNIQYIDYNGNGTETVHFYPPAEPGDYSYTVSILDAYGDVHILEADPAVPDFPGNNYYGVLTGYSNGGDFTVQNYTEHNPPYPSTSDNFIWLFTSAPDYSGSVILYSDATGGPFVPPVCFAEGTRILTAQGEIAVENLAIGDRVITASGQHRPIRWLGHRSIDCTRHPEPRSVWPIRVSAHAFGENRPSRDLQVSPAHALCVTCVDEVLIGANRLINGVTIVQRPVEQITYWHVELDSHDILIANGMPAESYLDMGNRQFFVESDAVDLHPLPDVPVRTYYDYCRPFVDRGPLLDVVRQQLTARAERLGWTRDYEVQCHVTVDGQTLQPLRAGNTLAFQVPSSAQDVRLISDVFVPSDMDGGGDRRALGLSLQRLSVSDASELRVVTVDDARLDTGFHPAERDGEKLWRWTSGEALLAPSLWEGLTGVVEINIDLECSSLRGWKRPDGAIERQQRQWLMSA